MMPSHSLWTGHSSGKVVFSLRYKYFHLSNFRPGFRESAFQPFKKEDEVDEEGDKAGEKETAEEEDSEADEMVDIEKIEDREEDTAGAVILSK